MGLPLNKRDFDVFLSHAHADQALVAEIDRWLSQEAGFDVWFDGRELGGGSLLATGLQAAIERCRSMVLVASPAAADSGWVESEYNSAMDERASQTGFRVIALRTPGADVSRLMKGLTWIDIPAKGLDASAATQLLRAFYPGDKRPNPAKSKDLYVSASWRDADSVSAVAVSRRLIQVGFRLIGDAKDQAGFSGEDRWQRIMASCGGFVAVVPYRGAESANATSGPYRYFMREIDHCVELGLPSLVVADPRVQREDGSDEAWLRMETDAKVCPAEVSDAAEALWDQWIQPPEPHYVFFAADLTSDAAIRTGPIRHLVERVTGMETVIGSEIHEQPLHSAILSAIQRSFLVLADITEDNIDVCIEAGMGLAAGRNVEILARSEPRRPPFMLRSLQFSHYADDLSRLGVVHRLVRPYRRRVINAEL